MNVCIVLVTYNRLEYTRKCISRLLEDYTQEFDLYLWDNASRDETPGYLNSIKDPRIVEIILSKENVGQTGAMNYVWSKTKAELVGKVDNDCLVTPGWTRILAKAHEDIEKLGAVACWHFFPEDFDYELAKHKIQTFNGHQIFRHPYVGGTGLLLKRRTFLEMGSWDKGPNVGTTYYFLKMALAGYINGWYYPLVYQEHMDDPVSDQSMLKDDKAINSLYDITYTLRNRKIKTMEKRMAWRRHVIRELLCGPWEPRYYVGWRSKLCRIKKRVTDLFSSKPSCNLK